MIQVHRELCEIVLPVMTGRQRVSFPQSLLLLHLFFHLILQFLAPLACECAQDLLGAFFFNNSSMDLMFASIAPAGGFEVDRALHARLAVFHRHIAHVLNVHRAE